MEGWERQNGAREKDVDLSFSTGGGSQQIRREERLRNHEQLLESHPKIIPWRKM